MLSKLQHCLGYGEHENTRPGYSGVLSVHALKKHDHDRRHYLNSDFIYVFVLFMSLGNSCRLSQV